MNLSSLRFLKYSSAVLVASLVGNWPLSSGWNRGPELVEERLETVRGPVHHHPVAGARLTWTCLTAATQSSQDQVPSTARSGTRRRPVEERLVEEQADAVTSVGIDSTLPSCPRRRGR